MSSLTVVIPCYNEASRGSGDTSFRSRLSLLMNQLSVIEYKVIMVDDGSSDDSAKVFEDFVAENNLYGSWICLRQERNMGKGRAVLRGIQSSNTDFILLLDADMSVEPYRVVPLIQGIRHNECYIGTRYAVNSKIANPRTPLRKFISFCCKTLVNITFGLGVSDSQCGFKLLPRDYCDKLTDFSVDSWIYDVEILYCLKCQGVAIEETAVRWDNMERESTVRAINSIIPSVKALLVLFGKKPFIKVHCRNK